MVLQRDLPVHETPFELYKAVLSRSLSLSGCELYEDVLDRIGGVLLREVNEVCRPTGQQLDYFSAMEVVRKAQVLSFPSSLNKNSQKKMCVLCVMCCYL